jgi:23S rRNA (guanosine2251-2'-O)-methyltransferase
MKGKTGKSNIVVICHNIRSAHNVGSIFRTADGAGVAKIYLSGYTPAPPHRGISKTALGAEDAVSWRKTASLSRLIEALKRDEFEIVALEQSSRGRIYTDYNSRKKIALILGNEFRGINDKILRKCDDVIEIPMRGKKESLNVSVAFGIVIYSITSK